LQTAVPFEADLLTSDQALQLLTKGKAEVDKDIIGSYCPLFNQIEGHDDDLNAQIDVALKAGATHIYTQPFERPSRAWWCNPKDPFRFTREQYNWSESYITLKIFEEENPLPPLKVPIEANKHYYEGDDEDLKG